MGNGMYFEVFAVKDGVRYNIKTVDMKTVSQILTNSLMDGVATICGFDTPKEKGGEG
jgi:hypothetical protein